MISPLLPFQNFPAKLSLFHENEILISCRVRFCRLQCFILHFPTAEQKMGEYVKTGASGSRRAPFLNVYNNITNFPIIQLSNYPTFLNFSAFLYS
jgi:hypothetical protein